MDFDRLNRKLAGLEKASTNGHKVKDLAHIMRNLEIWHLAYANIYSNKGAMTEGIDDDTLDGMSSERFQRIIERIKGGKYKPKPVRRASIPKRDGSNRPLGIPSGNDKLVQAVIKILLEQVVEPVFFETSHGFRPNRSCHTALKDIKFKWTGIKWLIEFDIKGCFDNINHDILIYLLEKRIDDKQFINLIKSFLKAGYMEDWKYNLTYSGTPQGGIISPILSNIYLHELDIFMADMIERFNAGKLRPVNPEYAKVSNAIFRVKRKLNKVDSKEDCRAELKRLQKLRLTIPYAVENTRNYRRLFYCRYADDFICGVTGSYKDAIRIKQLVGNFLQAFLELETSIDKTKIVRATKGIEFLGYKVKTIWGNKLKKVGKGKQAGLKRTISGHVLLEIPKHKVIDFCRNKGYGNLQDFKPIHRAKLLSCSEYEIVDTYNAELRGFANYYILAREVKRDCGTLFRVAQISLMKTLASRNKISVTKMYKRLKQGNDFILKYKVGKKVKNLKIFLLRHFDTSRKISENLDRPNYRIENLYKSGTELTKRMGEKICEVCGKAGYIEVHHVKKLRDLKNKKHLQNWEKIMIARNRKTLLVCSGSGDSCHKLIHKGQLPDKRIMLNIT